MGEAVDLRQLQLSAVAATTLTTSMACNGDKSMSRQSDPIDVDQLSVAERILVVQRIWDSIADQEASVPVTDAQREELDRRLEGYSSSPGEGATWDEVKSRLRADPS
jgi:putative addiction module component (TIGR02574 family)